MTQRAVPVLTLQIGGWAPIPGIFQRHQCVDEGTATHDGDSTYVRATSAAAASTALGLASLDDPTTHTGHLLRWVARAVGPTAGKQWKLELRRTSDNLKIHDTGWIEPGSTYASGASSLSEAEAALITDYSALALVLKTNGVMTWAAGDELRVTAIELEVPDAPLEEEMYATRAGVEVAGKAATTLRATRAGFEIASRRFPSIRLTRGSVEVAARLLNLYATRHGFEVASRAPAATMRATRIGLEVAARRPLVELRETRGGFEVAGKGELRLRKTRAGYEVAARNPLATIRLSRDGVEVVSRRPPHAIVPGDEPSILPKLSLANWQEALTIDAGWSTDVGTARSGAEDRRALRDRPTRALKIPFTGLTQQEASEFWFNLQAFADARLLLPFYTDYSDLIAESSGATLYCDTRYRRFFRGGRVVVHEIVNDRFVVGVEYATIHEILSDRLILTEALEGTYPKWSRVYPVVETETSLEQSAIFDNDQASTMELIVAEVFGRSAFPPSTPNGVVPTGVRFYDGHPIQPFFRSEGAKPVGSIVRAGNQYASGRTVVTELLEEKPRIRWDLQFAGHTRADAWQILQWLDYCQGRFRAFWMGDIGHFFELRAVNANSIDIAPWSRVEWIEKFAPAIVLEPRDGSAPVFRRITGVTEEPVGMGSVYRIAFDEPVALSIDEVRRTTTGRLSRFLTDGYRETWFTTERAVFDTQVHEVLNEGAHAIAGI